MFRIILFSLTLLACSLPAHAKKPDWPVKAGMGVIGFGLIEVEPQKKGDSYVPTEFTFGYHIDQEHASMVSSGQIIVIRANAFQEFNNVPEKEFIAHMSAERRLADSDFNMSVKVTFDTPGLFLVAYGPWDGLVSFDAPDSMEGYKISASTENGSFRWIDEDAGDLVTLNFQGTNIDNQAGTILRLHILRDPETSLDPSTYRNGEAFAVHPTALKRTQNIQAQW